MTFGAQTGAVFRELLEEIRGLEAKLLDGLGDEQSVLEGYRWIFSVLQVALDVNVWADRARPRFVDIVGPYKKWGGDNADAFYHYAPIDSSRTCAPMAAIAVRIGAISGGKVGAARSSMRTSAGRGAVIRRGSVARSRPRSCPPTFLAPLASLASDTPRQTAPSSRRRSARAAAWNARSAARVTGRQRLLGGPRYSIVKLSITVPELQVMSLVPPPAGPQMNWPLMLVEPKTSFRTPKCM